MFYLCADAFQFVYETIELHKGIVEKSILDNKNRGNLINEFSSPDDVTNLQTLVVSDLFPSQSKCSLR